MIRELKFFNLDALISVGCRVCLTIDDFHRRLKTEMAKSGWIDEPQKAEMQIIEEKEKT